MYKKKFRIKIGGWLLLCPFTIIPNPSSPALSERFEIQTIL